MLINAKHAVTVALAALSALVIHQLAYLAAYPVSTVRAEELADHGHLSTQWALVTPLCVVLVAAFIVRQVRNLHLAPKIRWAPLAALSGLFFVTQESVELLVQGGQPALLVANPATIIGLTLAPAIAIIIARAVHEASDLVARWLQPPPVVDPPERFLLRPHEQHRAETRLVSGSSPRGPPRLRCL